MSHRKWSETKQQFIWWPDLAPLGCCLVYSFSPFPVWHTVRLPCREVTWHKTDDYESWHLFYSSVSSTAKSIAQPCSPSSPCEPPKSICLSGTHNRSWLRATAAQWQWNLLDQLINIFREGAFLTPQSALGVVGREERPLKMSPSLASWIIQRSLNFIFRWPIGMQRDDFEFEFPPRIIPVLDTRRDNSQAQDLQFLLSILGTVQSWEKVLVRGCEKILPALA